MVKIFAPESYWNLSPEIKSKITNGCGTGGWKSRLIPDTMWFLNIRAACDIHDYMYLVGETENDRRDADMVFLNNLIRLINSGSKLMAPLRRRRALKYYEAVHRFGGPAFWNGKNPDNTMGKIGGSK